MISRMKSGDTTTIMSAFAATGLVIVLMFSAAIATSAYLTAASNGKTNEFRSRNYTYTDIDISEPNGSTYTITMDGTNKGLLGNGSGGKKAAVTNPDGEDKKPVFIRVAVTTDVYDKDGLNVTRSVKITPTFTQGSITADNTHHIPANANPQWSTSANAWTKVETDPVSNLVYFYYNAIVVPGDETFNIFDSVKLTGDVDKIPDQGEVRIRVIADAIQAVSTDDREWKAEDYTNAEIPGQWSKVPTVDVSGMTDAQKAARTPWAVTWGARN